MKLDFQEMLFLRVSLLHISATSKILHFRTCNCCIYTKSCLITKSLNRSHMFGKCVSTKIVLKFVENDASKTDPHFFTRMKFCLIQNTSWFCNSSTRDFSSSSRFRTISTAQCFAFRSLHKSGCQVTVLICRWTRLLYRWKEDIGLLYLRSLTQRKLEKSALACHIKIWRTTLSRRAESRDFLVASASLSHLDTRVPSTFLCCCFVWCVGSFFGCTLVPWSFAIIALSL